MFNLLGTWPDDDPHPLDRMAQKATDFVTPDMAKSVGACDHTDAHLTTMQYNFFNSPDSATIQRDETFFQVRQRSQDITQPQNGMSNAQKVFGSVATRNQQRGFEMEDPMGYFYEKTNRISPFNRGFYAIASLVS